MPFTSVTRLRLRKLRYMPGFVIRAQSSARQASRSEGFVGGYVTNAPGLTFWTVTVWRDAEAMAAYRAEEPHRSAMSKLADWCAEASVAHWEHDDEAVAPPEVAAQRLKAEGRLSKVRHPSPAQAAGETWPDGAVPRRGQPLRPSWRIAPPEEGG